MLKEKVIEFIKKNPDSVDMSIFIRESPMSACGTTACFAGHIVLASDVELEKSNCDIGELLPKINLSGVELDKYNKWVKFEMIEGADPISAKVPAYARYLWAKEYGNEAASSLPFYDSEWENVVGYTDKQLKDVDAYGPSAFNKLTSDDLIKYLESI